MAIEIETTDPVANSVPEACRRLGIGRTLLYQLIKTGDIKPVRLGHRLLIPESELHRIVAERMEKEAA